jgi:uncharacterized protein YbaR (Trm112 family)
MKIMEKRIIACPKCKVKNEITKEQKDIHCSECGHDFEIYDIPIVKDEDKAGIIIDLISANKDRE